jgi:hypothetical protein
MPELLLDFNPGIIEPMYLTYRKNPGILLLLALLPLFLFASPAVAEGFQITPFLGYRIGGDFEDANSSSVYELTEEGTYGIIFDKTLKSGNQIEFFYSKQPSRLVTGDTFITNTVFDVDVEYFHVGSRTFLNKQNGTYLVGTVGATRFSPDSPGISSETNFSLGLGGGIETGGDKGFGFRLESRFFGTFLDSSGAIFCGGAGGCTIISSNTFLWQLELIAGLSYKF